RPRRPAAGSPGGRAAGAGPPDGAQGLGPGAPGRAPPALVHRGREDHHMSQKGHGLAPLGHVLAGYLERSGLARKVEEASVVPAWPELVGPAIAAVTTPLRVADGVLRSEERRVGKEESDEGVARAR